MKNNKISKAIKKAEAINIQLKEIYKGLSQVDEKQKKIVASTKWIDEWARKGGLK